MKLSSRLDAIKPSITLAVTSKAAALRRQGIDVIGFGAGEPDFDTPAHIREAAKAAIDGGQTRYTDVAGTPELRKAVAKWLSAAHGLDLLPEHIVVSVGAKHSLFNLFFALLDAGDEVLVPAPYWVSYPEMVTFAGGTPVVVETTMARGLKARAVDLEAKLTPRTRAVILCSPSNPTGAVYDKRELAELAELCVARDLLVVSDDIYRSLVYGVPYCHLVNSVDGKLREQIRARTILVDGVSKTYAMTGWRIGVMAGPTELAKAVSTIQGQSTSNASSVAQAAALAALEGPQACVDEMRAAFDERRKVMVERLRAIPGVECLAPDGAFYVFPYLGAFAGRKTAAGKTLADDVQLSEYLLEAGRVAVVPGTGFGAPGFVRLSYATSMAKIEEGLGRMREALLALQK